MKQPEATAETIEWPVLTLKSGARFVLRYAYTADYILTVWKKTLADATALELGAAMAGSFDASGMWVSRGFKSPLELADLMEAADEAPLIFAVSEAIKKAYPGVEVSTRPALGNQTAETEPAEATKSES